MLRHYVRPSVRTSVRKSLTKCGAIELSILPISRKLTKYYRVTIFIEMINVLEDQIFESRIIESSHPIIFQSSEELKVHTRLSPKAVTELKVHSRLSPKAVTELKVHTRLSPKAVTKLKVHTRLSPKAVTELKVHTRLSPKAVTELKVHIRLSPKAVTELKVHTRLSLQAVTDRANIVLAIEYEFADGLSISILTYDIDSFLRSRLRSCIFRQRMALRWWQIGQTLPFQWNMVAYGLRISIVNMSWQILKVNVCILW